MTAAPGGWEHGFEWLTDPDDEPMDLHLTVNQEHALSQWNEGKLGPTWLSCPAWLLAICPFYCAGKEGSCAGHYSEPPEAR